MASTKGLLLGQQKPFPDIDLITFSMLTQRKARMNEGEVVLGEFYTKEVKQ